VPNILIVAATAFEIAPLLEYAEIVPGNTPAIVRGNHNTSVLITGVGMVNMAYAMGKVAGDTYDLIINAGVCGAFNQTLTNGTVVSVTIDVLSEMGAEDGDSFISYKDLNLGGTDAYSGKQLIDNNLLRSLPKTKGITVNTVHGNTASIAKIVALHQPDVESMEGAAFFRACENLPGDYLQVRAISNRVEKRDKSKWEMSLAIRNLNTWLIQFIQTVNP